jgi:eukaryotic-like serine/threonine-protein kinase
MAVVELARDTQLNRPVAIKVLAEALREADDFRERFVREARLAGRLSHPNVVRVFDAGEHDGCPYIVMEYVPGETLAQLLARRRKLVPTEVVGLGTQACAGLEHAHANGLVHRDLKPQNLILREDGVLKIADFGIAHAAETARLTQQGAILGTAAYLAPEQATGGEVTGATDLYSLGAVLYELLTGRTPYEFDSLPDLVEQMRNGAIVPVRNLEAAVPDALEAAIMRSLAHEPQFRQKCAPELRAALMASTEVVADKEPTATLALPTRVFASVPGSGSWPMIVTAVAVAAIGLAVGLSRIGGGGGQTAQPRPVPVSPIPRGRTPAAQARNLSAWLLEHSR